MNQLSIAGVGYHDGAADVLDAMFDTLRYMALSAAGLAIGTGSAAKVKIANTVTYVHNGLAKSKTTAEVDFTATTHDIAADALTVQERCYLVCLNAAGTPTLHAGDVATGSGNAVFPETPAGLTPIGGVRVAVAAGATSFDASTDLLSAAHLTDTYYDFIGPRVGKFSAAYENGGLAAA